MNNNQDALKAIQKKLVGKRLSYREIYAVMDEIANDRLGDILTTYFAASGYAKGFSFDEIYYLTKAMVETGEKLEFKGIIADKHSIGGLPGTRATMIVVPIVASAGFKIPKSSSRAITTPAGTADCMETIADVTFDKDRIYKIVEKTNGCIVWGGSFKIAPADDEIIHVEEPLAFESYDKILVSVMAKKIAFGSNHIIIDIPWGKTMKVHSLDDAQSLAKKFKYLAGKFDLKLEVLITKSNQPAGNGIGPLLEAADALRVLEQSADRPLDLEEKSLDLSGALLDLCIHDASDEMKNTFKARYKSGREWATEILKSGKAHEKMMEIIKAQGGNAHVKSTHLRPGKFSKIIKSSKSGVVAHVNCRNISILAKILGAPQDARSGLFLHRRMHDKVAVHGELYTLYSDSEKRISEAVDSIQMFPIYEIE